MMLKWPIYNDKDKKKDLAGLGFELTCALSIGPQEIYGHAIIKYEQKIEFKIDFEI